MKTNLIYFSFAALLLFPLQLFCQTDYLKDSIYIDKGIAGTPDFEPLFKVIYGEKTESGLPNDLIVYNFENGDYSPLQKQEFIYEDDLITLYRVSNWSNSIQVWIPIKEELTTYEDGLVKTFLRKKITSNGLTNDRLWEYQYDSNGNETEILLRGWNEEMNDWENLSLKTTTYNEKEIILTQVLQRFVNGEWRNQRQRIWRYEENGFQPVETISQTWSNSDAQWVNRARKSYSLNDDMLWTGNTIQEWDGTTESWTNDIKEGFIYSESENTYNWEAEVWNDGWQKYLKNEYFGNENINVSTVKEWDDISQQHINKLRYGNQIDERGLVATKLGMQSWSANQSKWLNRDFTRKIQYFYSEPTTSIFEQQVSPQLCKIPNPFGPGNGITCKVENPSGSLKLEITNIMGQKMAEYILDDAVIIPALKLIEGLYVFKIYDQEQIYHLEKIVYSSNY